VAECARASARGLETQSCPRTGLLMTGDVTEVRPLSPGSGEGPRQVGRARRRGEERGTSHQTHALPDLWFLIARGGGPHGSAQSLVNSVPTARVRRVAHSPSPRYAARNFSIEKTVPLASMEYTARPILCARIESAFPLRCFFSSRARSFLPSVVWRRKSTAASEKAHPECAARG
jgi:hypothetical protein